MAEALRRARLSDTALVAVLLLVLSVVHFVLLEVERSHRFHRRELQRGYRVCLLASWAPLLLGASALGYFWCVGRAADKKHFSTATRAQLAAVMGAAGAVALGCVLLAVAEALWVAEIGFERFHVVTLLGLLSLVLLLWVAFHVVLVVREAAAVRRHLKNHPPAAAAAAEGAPVQAEIADGPFP